jgi:hypothetical protein
MGTLPGPPPELPPPQAVRKNAALNAAASTARGNPNFDLKMLVVLFVIKISLVFKLLMIATALELPHTFESDKYDV